MVRFRIAAVVVVGRLNPAPPMKNTRTPGVALVDPPSTVMLLLPPLILVLLPRIAHDQRRARPRHSKAAHPPADDAAHPTYRSMLGASSETAPTT
jgi:hypothetical protein